VTRFHVPRRFASLPLAWRLTVTATAVLAVALFIGGLGFRDALHREQQQEINRAANERVFTLVQVVQSGSIPTHLSSARDSQLFAQIIDPTGHVVAATNNVDDMQSMVNLTEWKPTLATTIGKAAVDKAACVIYVRGVDTSTGRYGVIVAAPTRQATQALSALTRQMIAIAPIVVLFAAALFWLLARRALRPVDTLRTEVDAISGTDLHRRVSAPAADDEVGRLAKTMNSLLGRLESANDRQTRFVSDASHELRSPLAGIRTKMEVALRNPERTDWPVVARAVLNDSSRMERLTGDLLFLAKNDGTPTNLFSEVDLDDLVLEEVATQRMRTSIPISTTGVSGGRVCGDVDQLRRVIINLLDNAVRFAESSIICRVIDSAQGVVLQISDDGPGIALDQRDRIFERFTRIDEDRSRDRGGAGLGLAIVADIVRAHSASIDVLAAKPHGTIMNVTFPRLTVGN
jgi:signal transduction histidine kinase